MRDKAREKAQRKQIFVFPGQIVDKLLQIDECVLLEYFISQGVSV
jgi:hypothetical protein